MTPDLISLSKTTEGQDRLRVMLSELVGWKHYGCTGCACHPCVCNEWIHESTDGVPATLPDFTRDLNAVQAVWESLHEEAKHTFTEMLNRVVSEEKTFWCLCATATQRTTALILTLQSKR